MCICSSRQQLSQVLKIILWSNSVYKDFKTSGIKDEKLSRMSCGWRSDWIRGVSVVDLLPHHRAADAEEVPEVAEDPAVERVLLVPAVLQVGDPVPRHELPGGAVDGDQVEVAAQQQRHHHGENPDHAKRRQQEAVHSEPKLPRHAG